MGQPRLHRLQYTMYCSTVKPVLCTVDLAVDVQPSCIGSKVVPWYSSQLFSAEERWPLHSELKSQHSGHTGACISP